ADRCSVGKTRGGRQGPHAARQVSVQRTLRLGGGPVCLSWQLILTNPAGEKRPCIAPSLLFVGNVYGKAEEASDFYISIFNDAKRGTLVRYPAGMEPDKEGAVMFTDFMLEGQWFAAMDSAREHNFAFNEAVSFMVYCNDQSEIDYYWEK